MDLGEPSARLAAWPETIVMPTKKISARYKDLVEDADGALRALSRRFPEALPALMLRPGEEIVRVFQRNALG